MSFDYNSFDAFNEAMRKPQRPKKIKRVRRERSPKITIYSYLASRVPSDAHYVINKYGKYRRARNARELEYQLKDFVKTFGDNGLKELANIHPDRHLLELHCAKCSNADKKNNDMSSLLEAQSKMMLNASGNNNGAPSPTPAPTADNTDKIVGKINSNMLITGGFVIMAVALLIKYKK
tara:strand:+ start:11290 stop:11823 length:534 start_codon:yes stop_codon:yes gene_type:complete